MTSAKHPSTKPRVHLPLSWGRLWLFAPITCCILAAIVVMAPPNLSQILVLGLLLVVLYGCARASTSTEQRQRPTGAPTGILSGGLFGQTASLKRLGVMLNLVVVVALFGTGASPAAFGRSSTSQTVLPPQPPRSCNIPPGAVTVRTATQLQSELAKKTPQDIAIPPGDYAPSTVLKPAAPHRLWGTHANDVTVRAGFLFTGAGAPGFEVHCLTLDVPNVNKADRRSGTAIINSVRRWTDITIADSRLLGNGKVGRAVFAQVPNGLTVERVEIRGFTRDGIRAKTGSGRVILRDLDIRDIERPGPATYNGTAEAGIFMDTAATIERVRVRDAYWMGIGTYANDITIRDLDVDGSIVGVYLEHYTHRLVLEYFHIGPDNKKGINFESENPARYKGGPTTVDALIQDGVVEAHRVGAAVNDGQKNPTIRRVTFRGQCGAAIVANRPRSTGEVYVDNDFSGIRPGAVEMTSKHSNAFKCG